MVTVTHQMYSGSGYPLSNGDGTAITYDTTEDSADAYIIAKLDEIRAVLGGPGSTITQMLGASAAQQQQIAVYSRGAAALGMVGSLIAPELGIPLALGAEVIAIANELDLGGDVVAPDQMVPSYSIGISDGSYPVTPVTPPPAGYGGDAAEDIAAAVFAYGVNWQNATGEVTLQFRYWLQEVMAALSPGSWAEGVPDPRNPYFSLVAAYPTAITYGALIPWSASAIPPVPALDFSSVFEGDTLLTYLNREVSDYTWTNAGPWGESTPAGAYAALSGEYAGRYWRCNLTTAQLHLLAGQLGGAGAPNAPVWPGVDNVEFGDPVAVVDAATIPGPLHGVVFEMTVAPSKLTNREIEGYTSYWRLGMITFVDDNGSVETFQYLQWEQGVYCPRQMQSAASAIIQLEGGAEASVTPWTRST